MEEVNHKDLEVLIERNYEAEIPLYIWGATGIGKSETVDKKVGDISKRKGKEYVKWNKLSKKKKHEVAENPSKYFFLMDIRLSQLDPSDLRGLPGLNGRDVVEWKIPFWLYVASLPEAEGVVFFDEINLAPPSIQASAYQIILDRELGETPISDGVVTIAAGNRLEDRANVFDLPRPLQNRFTHVLLSPPRITEKMNGDWGEWAMNHGVDTRIITYLVQHPGQLNPLPKKNSSERAFPTPRSWGKYCSKLIKGVNDLHLIEQLASISVGSGAAKQLVSHIKFRDSINFYDILRNPELAKKIEGLDLLYSLSSLVSEWYDLNYNKKKGEKYSGLEKILQIVKYVEMNHPEFSMLILRFCRAKHPNEFRNELINLPTWKSLRGEYRKYLLT